MSSRGCMPSFTCKKCWQSRSGVHSQSVLLGGCLLRPFARHALRNAGPWSGLQPVKDSLWMSRLSQRPCALQLDRNVLQSHMCGSGERIQSIPAVVPCACSVVYTFLSVLSFFFELFALMEPFFSCPKSPAPFLCLAKLFGISPRFVSS